MSYNFLDKTGLTYFWGKIKDYISKITRNDLAVISSKEYSGIYGSANDQAGASFYFATIRPNNFYQMWRVKFRVYANVPNQNEYIQYSEVEYYGNKSDIGYKIFNRIANTSGRCYYYNNLCRVNLTGYNAGYAHIAGVGLRSSNNPTSSSYPRTFKIELLETENCTFTFYDSMKKIANISEYSTTNYAAITEYDGSNNGLRETGDDTNIWQLRHNSGNFVVTTALYRYMICLQKNETTLIPMNTVNNSTATTKTLTTDEFNPFGAIVYYNSTTTVNANASVGASTLFEQIALDLRYSFNTGTTLTAHKDVYMVAVPQTNGMAKLHSTPITQTLPTSENGLIYILLGRAYSNYQIELYPIHPIYQYKNGNLRLYTNDMDKVDILGHSTVSRAVESSGYLKFAECDLSYGGYGNKYVVLFVTTEYATKGKDGNGIVYINIRGNGTGQSSVSNFYWLLNDDSASVDTLYWAVSDHKVEFYRKVFAANEYAQVSFKILHVGNFETAKYWEFKLLDIPFVEGTPLDTPIGDVHAIVSGGKVKEAESATKATGDKNGADITTTYYKASNPDGYTTNTGTITGISVNGTSIATSGVANIVTNTTYNSSTNKLATMTDVVNNRGSENPIATILAYAGSEAPNGYLLCRGQAVSRTTYSLLFNAIGTQYGSGDGSTTFNIPDLQGKVIAGLDIVDEDFNVLGKTGGSKTVQLTKDQLPNIYGRIIMHSGESSTNIADVTGDFSASLNNANKYKNGGSEGSGAKSKGDVILNVGNDEAHENKQPYSTLNYIIKAYSGTDVPIPVELSSVKNVYDNNTSNVYSTEYINTKVRGKKLWTNPNPTSDFAPQTINFGSTNDYDFYKVEYKPNKSLDFTCYQDINTNSTRFNLFNIIPYTPDVANPNSKGHTSIQFRGDCSCNNSSMTFSGTCHYRSNEDTKDINDYQYIIPIAIYGCYI